MTIVGTIRKFNLKTGIDALEFVKPLRGDWNCIIWDPPYMEWRDKTRWKNQDNTRIAINQSYRYNLISTIMNKMNEEGYIIEFNTKYPTLGKPICKHIWVKGWKGNTGSAELNNGEFIYIYQLKHKKIIRRKGNLLEKYIYQPQSSRNQNNNVRACEKPKLLWIKLFKHVNAKYILDPFMGKGNQIAAAIKLNLKIDGCDIDDSLEWGKYDGFNQIEQLQQTTLEGRF